MFQRDVVAALEHFYKRVLDKFVFYDENASLFRRNSKSGSKRSGIIMQHCFLP